MTAACFHHHILILFQNNIRALVKVQHGNAAEFCGRTTGFRHPAERVHQMHEGLHDGVVGGVHVGVEGEGALAVAVEGGIAVRGYDPIFPAEVPEVWSWDL